MHMIRRTLLALALVILAPSAGLAQSADEHVHGPLPPVTAEDRALGSADAPVTVIEYASFSCPHCADWHRDVFPVLKTRYIDTGRVRLVFRDLPTSPPQLSYPAAMIAHCAAPERFFDVATAFFDGQAAVRSALQAGGDAREWFIAGAMQSGRLPEEIVACATSEEAGEALQARAEAASAAGVHGTPSFFVNGQAVADGSIETLSAAIEAVAPSAGGRP